nr:YdcF family protein [Spirulina subsalsa]
MSVLRPAINSAHRVHFPTLCLQILGGLGLAGVGLGGYLMVRIAIATYQAPQPQAILTLGGDFDREFFTAHFALSRPDLDIWISSGGLPQDLSQQYFHDLGIPESRLHYDQRAVDTVTNFTSLVHDLKQQDIQHLYLITSDFHMRRAKLIAALVLGSHGVIITPVSVPTRTPPESPVHILRDGLRGVLWILTGRTGANLNRTLLFTSPGDLEQRERRV